MYLSRYVISKESVILEIDPVDGSILRRFSKPSDWEWNPEREKANWEEYNGKTFLVYKHEGDLVFQEGKNRFVLDSTYSTKMERKGFKWILFQLFRGQEKVYEFKYQDPQTRKESLLRALAFDDDWWDWDTPFEDVHKYLAKNS
jgi:hypothetical protein